MQPLLVSYSDGGGGAARAAQRLHASLRALSVESSMLVSKKLTGDASITGPTSNLSRAYSLLATLSGSLISHLQRTPNPIIHSPALIPSKTVSIINNSHSTCVNLHWINGEMIPIPSIPKIRFPMAWTLHDMWAFCGTEHIPTSDRWMTGYTWSNRPAAETWLDLDWLIWKSKRFYWKTPFQLVTPSSWLAKCVRSSKLLGDWPVVSIPNPIDLEFWRPLDQTFCRNILGIKSRKPLLLFGSHGANGAPHKGADLLLNALIKIQSISSSFDFVLLGNLPLPKSLTESFNCIFFDHLNDDISMLTLYNAVDAVVIPSRVDNFPNMAVEAHACGKPVLAFNTCGLPDIVSDKSTGLLALPFSTDELASNIQQLMLNPSICRQYGMNARQRACDLWDSKLVAERYIQLYKSL